MRFLIAGVLGLFALVGLTLGIGDRTLWAPPKQQVLTSQIAAESPFVLVPPSIVGAHPGQPRATVKAVLAEGGDPASVEQVFVSYGRYADLKAWLEKAQYAEVKLAEAGAKNPIAIDRNNIGLAGPDPAGSDLWYEEDADSLKVSLDMKTLADTAMLISTKAKVPTAVELQLVWPVVHDLTFSNWMIWLGSGFGVLALAALIWAFRHKRVIRGPRRRITKPPKGPKIRVKRNKDLAPKRGRRAARRWGKIVATPLVFSLVFATAGCAGASSTQTGLPQQSGGSASPSASESPAPQAPAALTKVQFERILTDVSEVAKNADKGNNKKILEERFAGPALQMRSVQYVLRKKNQNVEAPAAIAAKPITFALPAATDAWPRIAMAVTDAPGDALPQMLVLQQEDPRSNYKVWYVSSLLPGVKIPAVATAEVGAIPVERDSVFIKLPPNQLATAFGDILNKGRASLSAPLFDLDNQFYQQLSTSQKNQIEALTQATVTFKHSLGNPNTMALATADTGALVAVFMNDVYTVKPRVRSSAVAVEGLEKLLLGSGGSTTGVQTVYGDMLFFYVPPVSSKKTIELLGVTQGLLSIRKL